MFEINRLSTLPPFAKLFIGLFTTLMLFVCVWAVWIYSVEKGVVSEGDKPLYLQDETQTEPEEHDTPDFRHNLGLAHTHINGQTLLFFAIGLIFLFTSVSCKTKKTVLWVFAISIVVHVTGLTGQGFHFIFDDVLAISGVVILLSIVYMALRIYVDLAKTNKRPVP
jgi:hypothetical protein